MKKHILILVTVAVLVATVATFVTSAGAEGEGPPIPPHDAPWNPVCVWHDSDSDLIRIRVGESATTGVTVHIWWQQPADTGAWHYLGEMYLWPGEISLNPNDWLGYNPYQSCRVAVVVYMAGQPRFRKDAIVPAEPTPTPTPVPPTPIPPTPTPVVPTPTPVPPTPEPTPVKEEAWVDGWQKFEPDRAVLDPTLYGEAFVWSWNVGISDGILYIPIASWWDIESIEVKIVKWDGSGVPWTIENHPEWGTVIKAQVGKLGAQKTWTNWVSYQVHFELAQAVQPGLYSHVSRFTWTYGGKPWGNSWSSLFTVEVTGRIIRVLNPDDTYTVTAGDTLYSIARSFGTTIEAMIEAIALANKIINPNLIYVGQRLVIP